MRWRQERTLPSSSKKVCRFSIKYSRPDLEQFAVLGNPRNSSSTGSRTNYLVLVCEGGEFVDEPLCARSVIC